TFMLISLPYDLCFPFFLNHAETTEIYTLSLHDALPIFFDLDNTLLAGDSDYEWGQFLVDRGVVERAEYEAQNRAYYQQYVAGTRSEEHTSELQSRENLVCRLLLEKKKK